MIIEEKQPSHFEAIDRLEVIERIYRAIKGSDLDCADWQQSSQELLAHEIARDVEDLIEERILRVAA